MLKELHQRNKRIGYHNEDYEMRSTKGNIQRIVFLTLAVLLFAAAIAEQAYAIPPFARKYNLSCTTCHDPFPRLKEYGEEFAGNGFRLPDKEEPARAYMNTGDDRLVIQRDLPLGFRFDANYMLREDESETKNDFQAPWGLKILSGGSISENIGYYMYFYMSEHGEVAGIEDAYIHFNNIGGSELDIMVGQFQISDPLFKRELRMTYEDYEFYKTNVGASQANLAYDRGVFMTYATKSATEFALQVVNGNGKGEASGINLYDDDKYKNVFFRVSQDIPLGEESPISFRVGGFTYVGKEERGGKDNSFHYVGPDFTIGGEKFELSGQYIIREDDNPFFMSQSNIEETTESIIAEMILMPDDYWYLVALYNSITSDNGYVDDYRTLSLNATYLHKTNFKMFAEYRYDLEYEKNRLMVGFVAGF